MARRRKFRGLGGARVYKGAIKGRPHGNPGQDVELASTLATGRARHNDERDHNFTGADSIRIGSVPRQATVATPATGWSRATPDYPCARCVQRHTGHPGKQRQPRGNGVSTDTQWVRLGDRFRAGRSERHDPLRGYVGICIRTHVRDRQCRHRAHVCRQLCGTSSEAR